MSAMEQLRAALAILSPGAEGADTASPKQLAAMVAEEALYAAGFPLEFVDGVEADCQAEIARTQDEFVLATREDHAPPARIDGATLLCSTPADCCVEFINDALLIAHPDRMPIAILLDHEPGVMQAAIDAWWGSACTAHVDPLAAQQAQTARQASANASLPCASCGAWLKPNNGVTVGGKLYHAGCAPSSLAGASAQQAISTPTVCLKCYGSFVVSGQTATCGSCNRMLIQDLSGKWVDQSAPGVTHITVTSCAPTSGASPTDFGAQVSDQLARQREIGGSAKPDAMRVPTEDEKAATRKVDAAKIAEIMRDYR